MLIDEIESSKENHGEIGRTLSPAEQKHVLGGFEDPGTGGCATSQCSVYDGSTGTTYYGDCGYVPMPGFPPPTARCECDTELGYYDLPPGRMPSCTVL